jgi:hypothetical protein
MSDKSVSVAELCSITHSELCAEQYKLKVSAASTHKTRDRLPGEDVLLDVLSSVVASDERSGSVSSGLPSSYMKSVAMI